MKNTWFFSSFMKPNFSDFGLENPVFLTSEIPGFSEPKLEKPCISEFRKTKSEKSGIYKAEKRSISESEKLRFSVFQNL